MAVDHSRFAVALELEKAVSYKAEEHFDQISEYQMLVVQLQECFPYPHRHFLGAHWGLAKSLAPWKPRVDEEEENQHDSGGELVGLLRFGRGLFLWLLWLLFLVFLVLASLLEPGSHEFLDRGSCIRAIGVEVLWGSSSWDETVSERVGVEYCIATETGNPGSGQRWTSCDHLDPVDAWPAAGRDGEDSCWRAAEEVRVAVGLSH